MSLVPKISFIFLLTVSLFAAAAGQEKKNQKPAPANTSETPLPAGDVKKNGRPAANSNTSENGVDKAVFDPELKYEYVFERPGFTYPHILLEHGDDGKGRIVFIKAGWEESVEDPVELSRTSMQNLRTAFESLDFLNSTEVYQTDREYSTMGNASITLRKKSKERTAKFNWSDNKQAKFLLDEYRRLANEYIWYFEFDLARTNQPLHTPSLMELMDSYLRRNEISDPKRLMPILTKYSTDERLPLIARNHAAKLLKEIEKSKK